MPAIWPYSSFSQPQNYPAPPTFFVICFRSLQILSFAAKKSRDGICFQVNCIFIPINTGDAMIHFFAIFYETNILLVQSYKITAAK